MGRRVTYPSATSKRLLTPVRTALLSSLEIQRRRDELPFFASPEAYVLVFESDSGRLSIVTETRRFTRWTITRIAQNVKGTSFEYKA